MGKLSKTFPNAKSVDSALKRANKSEVDILNINREIPLKANKADVAKETQNLQEQIDNIIIASEESKIQIEKSDVILESYIAQDGSIHQSGTGTGNNWCTELIRVPIGETIHVISPIARCSVAAYDEDETFSSFVSGAWNAPLRPGEYLFLSTVPYIRLAFYDPNGYTDEKYDGVSIFYRNAEAGGDVALEVAQARAGYNGKSHDTLKNRLDSEMSQANIDIDLAFDSMYRLKPASLSKNVYVEKTNVIEESFINQNGDVAQSGTGTGNNWCTEFMRVPVGETIHVISPLAKCSIVAYTKDKVFSDFVSGAWNAPLNAGEYTFISTEPYIRLSFYDSNGYTSEKYENVSVFYRVSEIELIEQENMIDSIPWSLCMIGNNQMNFSATTVGSSALITLDKPAVLEILDSDYKIGLVYVDPEDYSNTSSHTWFDDVTTKLSIPAGIPFYIGIRNKNTSNQKLLKYYADIISLKEYNDIVFGVASKSIFQGYNFINISTTSHRVAKIDMFYADEDLLLRPRNDASVYTLIMFKGTTPNYYSSVGWSAEYSKNVPIIIPKGTWYNYSTCFKEDDTEYGTEDMAKEMYEAIEIVPVSKLDYLTNGLQSTQSQIATLLRRINILEYIHNMNIVPAYYSQHISDKISEIRSHNATTRFGFITDTHYNGYNNAKHSKALMTEICKEIPEICHFFNGGDLVNTATNYTKEKIIRNLNEASNYTRPDCYVKYHNIIGNHDTGEDYVGGVKVPAKLTVEEYANATGSYLSYVDEVYDPLNCSQYYVDDGDIRYIVLNGNLREITGETYTDTWRFFARSLLSANNKTIVVFNHIIRGSNMQIAPFSQTIMDAIDAYNAREEFTYSGATFDFSNSNGQVACFIGGHTHEDENFTTTDGVPVIITTTDNAGAEVGELVRTIGTTSEQAFDIFTIDTSERKIYATRIGAGESRVFEY